MDVRVAILEDQQIVRDALTEVLNANACQVVFSSGNAGTFLAHLSEEQPSVAIIDLTLENDDGSQNDATYVLNDIRQWHPQVRTLVLSASRDKDGVERCFAAGASGYLHKLSATSQALVDAVRSVGSGDRSVPFSLASHAVGAGGAASRVERSASSVLSNVTEREREVLAYVSTGADNLKIAALLRISERTVKAHVSALYKKLGPENRAQLALMARQLGIRPPTGV